MYEFKKFCQASSEQHAQNICKKMSEKGAQVTYNKKTFEVFYVRLAKPKATGRIVIRGEQKKYYRA